MKKPTAIFILILCLYQTVAQTTNHALLVSVGDYPEYTGWAKLKAVNDTWLMRNTLLLQGFQANNIHTLVDAEVTRQRILEAIYQQLTLRVRPGDVAIFHFSGHGQQVQDDNGDEIDGLDEALVPYNSPMRFEAGINYGQYLLRDDELGEALRMLRERLGPNGHLLVLLDACHSGTATRGPAIAARGTNIIMAAPDYINNLQEKAQDATVASDWSVAEAKLAPLVVLSGSSPNQSSYEYRDYQQTYGIFSHAFSKTLSNLPPDASYRSMLAAIRQEVAFRTSIQTPLGEGAMDMVVLGGGVQPRDQYFTVKRVLSSHTIQIEAGALQGCTQGSTVALYPPNVTDTLGVSPLSMGFVHASGTFESEISLENPLTLAQIQTAKVFIREQNYGALRVTLTIRLQDKTRQAQLEQVLSSYPFIVLTNTAADLTIEENIEHTGQRMLILYKHDGMPLSRFPLDYYWDSSSKGRQLASTIADYARADFLRRLETDSPHIQATLRVLVSDGQGNYSPLSDRLVRLGESIKLEVINRGNKPFYFSILDIQPNNKINKIVPGLRPAADFYLRPFTYWRSDAFNIGEPEGMEVLKVIASSQPVEFNFSRSSSQGAGTPLAVLLGSLLSEDSASRSAAQSLPADSGHISSLILQIVR